MLHIVKSNCIRLVIFLWIYDSLLNPLLTIMDAIVCYDTVLSVGF